MDLDYTGHTGPIEILHEPPFKELPQWRMYSFSLPAAHFWNGAANYLHEIGKTDDEIGEIFMSKAVRWMLDHGPINDTHITQLGYDAMKQYLDRNT